MSESHSLTLTTLRFKMVDFLWRWNLIVTDFRQIPTFFFNSMNRAMKNMTQINSQQSTVPEIIHVFTLHSSLHVGFYVEDVIVCQMVKKKLASNSSWLNLAYSSNCLMHNANCFVALLTLCYGLFLAHHMVYAYTMAWVNMKFWLAAESQLTPDIQTSMEPLK